LSDEFLPGDQFGPDGACFLPAVQAGKTP
jgi:hypothetical protein